MRHSWRFVLLRSNQLRSHLRSTLPHSPRLVITPTPNVNCPRHFGPFAHPQSSNTSGRNIPITRCFTSEAAVEDPDQAALLTEIFSKYEGPDEIKREIELNNVTISHDVIVKVLRGLGARPDVARKFFGWVSDGNSDRLSSKAFNSMLWILGTNGLDDEFWSLIDKMKKKGYGVSKTVKDKVLLKFDKEGRASDVKRLKDIFATGSIDNSTEKLATIATRIVKKEVWSGQVERKLQDLNLIFSSELVSLILEGLASEPAKALILFRWVEESGLCKHNQLSYNAMATVSGREDCIDRFWNLVNEMRAAGYEMEMETYHTVLRRFLNRKMTEEVVCLYEFAMGGSNKPPVADSTFVLKKVAVSKDFDLNLISRVVKAFTENGIALTDYMLNAVMKSLTTVGRLGEYNNVLTVMKKSGFIPGSNMRSKMAFQLSRNGKQAGPSEFMENVDAKPDCRTWMSLIEGHCVGKDVEKASEYLKEMARNENGTFVSNACETVVTAYCNRNRGIDACKLLQDCVSNSQVKPLHTTYKHLISSLIVQGGFNEALSLLSLMRNDGYPPFLDPFIGYISKRGTAEEAVAFSKAMTSHRFPSTCVYMRVFKAFFQARRQEDAQEFLAKCPRHIRDHADILDLFCPKPMDTVATPTPEDTVSIVAA